MSANDPSIPELPADFDERYADIHARLCAGEQMTVQYVADQLGLSYEFLATTLAVYCAATHRVPVLVDTSPAPSLH